MRRCNLAKRLVSAGSDRERRLLLKANPRIADAGLAREIKDICYSGWTAEPVVARKAAAALRLLASKTADGETHAIAFWISGIAKITQSKFEDAVGELDTAAKVFHRTGKQIEAAQTQVAKLIALALLGRYKEADIAGRSALAVFERSRDELAAGKIEMNLSNVAARREMHHEAETYALSALRRFKRIGEKSWQTMAENDLANTYSEINDFRRAERYFAMAAASAKATRMLLTQAEIEASIGNLEMFRGRYADALRYLELSRQKYEKLALPHQTAIAELEIAEIYAELNLVNEATSMLQALVGRLRKLRLKADEARARSIFARLLSRQDQHKAAMKQLKRARQIYSIENNTVGIARTDIFRAEIMLRTGDFLNAEDAAKLAHEPLEKSGNKRLAIAAEWLRAEAVRLRGQSDDARALLRSVVTNAKRAEVLNIAVVGLTSLGNLESSSGNSRAAKSAYGRAITIIENMRSPIATDEFRMSFFAGHIEPYDKLFRIAAEEGRVQDAFAIHESSRARSLVDLVDAGSDTGSPGKLAKQLSNIREELNWFYSRLSRTEASDVAVLETEIASRERQISKLTRQLDSLAAKRGRETKMSDLSGVRAKLKNDTALIEYVNVDGSLAAFVVTNESIDLVDGLGTESEVKQLLDGLRFQFGTLRFGTAAVRNFIPQLKRNADDYLSRLYTHLISPMENLINAKRLVIAPTGALNYVPFNALFDGERYLIEKRSVSVTPSANVWQSLRGKRKVSSDEYLLIGYSDKSIPLAASEVKAVKRKLDKKAISFAGRRATIRAFLENAPNADLIHLACHGQFRSDNPMFSSLHLADGWVTVRDVARQKLKARLVILSACETGLSEIQKGEELLGLTRGFLSAGAQNLIVSLWTVNDESTSRLMSDIYTNLQLGDTPAASLRAAQMKFIARGIHPYFWSPFVSIGQ